MSGEITESNEPVCEVCRDLNENHFKYKEGGTDIFVRATIGFHYVEFDKLRESAIRGCRLCRILQQGTSFFWGEDPARPFETNRVKLEDEQSDIGSLKSGDRPKSEELVNGNQSRNLMRIEVRPKQSLLVTRITYISADGYLFNGMRAPLEFYTKPGMYCTIESNSFGINTK